MVHSFVCHPACNDVTEKPAFHGNPVNAGCGCVVTSQIDFATVNGDVGNPDAGRQLVYTCQGCHGLTGYQNAYPTFHVPRIGGQSSEYLAQALHEYREGKRKHPTMQAQAQSFSDQDIADIAAFLSTYK